MRFRLPGTTANSVHRLKQLREGAFTHEESMMAAGLRVDNGPEKPKTEMEVDTA